MLDYGRSLASLWPVRASRSKHRECAVFEIKPKQSWQHPRSEWSQIELLVSSWYYCSALLVELPKESSTIRVFRWCEARKFFFPECQRLEKIRILRSNQSRPHAQMSHHPSLQQAISILSLLRSAGRISSRACISRSCFSNFIAARGVHIAPVSISFANLRISDMAFNCPKPSRARWYIKPRRRMSLEMTVMMNTPRRTSKR